MSTENDASEKNALLSFNVKDFGAVGNNQNESQGFRGSWLPRFNSPK